MIRGSFLLHVFLSVLFASVCLSARVSIRHAGTHEHRRHSGGILSSLGGASPSPSPLPSPSVSSKPSPPEPSSEPEGGILSASAEPKSDAPHQEAPTASTEAESVAQESPGAAVGASADTGKSQTHAASAGSAGLFGIGGVSIFVMIAIVAAVLVPAIVIYIGVRRSRARSGFQDMPQVAPSSNVYRGRASDFSVGEA